LWRNVERQVILFERKGKGKGKGKGNGKASVGPSEESTGISDGNVRDQDHQTKIFR